MIPLHQVDALIVRQRAYIQKVRDEWERAWSRDIDSSAENRRALAAEAYAEAKVRVARYLETGDLADLFPERNSPVDQGAAAPVPKHSLGVTKPTTPP
jgi:hypothetical protein